MRTLPVQRTLVDQVYEAIMDFHFFLYGLSGNPLVAEMSAAHWSYLRRVMGEVLLQGESPANIWDQHEAVIAAVPREAEKVARHHISHASETLIAGLANYRRAEATAVASRRQRNRMSVHATTQQQQPGAIS